MIALLETVRVIGGEVPLWPLHLSRLGRSASELGLAIPDLLPPDPAGGSDRIVRCRVDARGVSVSERPVVPIAALSLAISSEPHRGYPHKFADRGWLEAAGRAARDAGADDALLLDRDGMVTEATRWAVGWWSEAGLVFPDLSLGILRSVARARLEAMVPGGLRSARSRPEDLGGRSLVACNAARGLVPVAALDGIPLPEDPRTRELAARFWGADKS